MDDTTATEHMTAEVAHLHRCAPANIAHTLRLVHRTNDDDRGIGTGGPVRGSAPPLA